MNSGRYYQLFADAVLIVHVGVVLFVVVGLVLIIVGNLKKWPWVNNLWFRLAHLSAIAFVVAETWLGITLPTHHTGNVAARARQWSNIQRQFYRALVAKAAVLQCACVGIYTRLFTFWFDCSGDVDLFSTNVETPVTTSVNY